MEYVYNDAALNRGVISISNENYLTFGAFQTLSNSERLGAVLKLNSNGNISDTFFLMKPQSFIEFINGYELKDGFLIIGQIRNFIDNNYRPYFIRLNENLDTIWTKTMNYSDSVSVFVSYSIMCKDSTIAITGIYTDSTDDKRILLLKTDTLGNQLFLKSYGYANEHQSNYWNLDQTFDGGFILAGTSTYYHPLGAGYYTHLAIKTDSLGNLQWNFPWGRTDNQNGGCWVKAMSDSTIIVYTTSPVGPMPNENLRWNFRKLRYNQSTVWYKENGPDAENIGIMQMVETSDKGFVANKYISNRLWITRYDSLGNMLWSRLNKPSVSQFTGGDIDFVESDGGFVYSGFIQPQSSLGDTGTQDIFVIKTNCIGWADPPFANATTGSLDNFEVVLENNSMYFGNVYIDWGDGNLDTLYESSDTLIYHTYATDGNFNATIIAEACGDKDTLNLNVVSSLVGIEEHTKQIFRVYPNPANEIFFIQMENTVSNYEIILSDITGKIILRKENAKQIDVSELSNGFYFISIPELNHTEKIQIMK